MTSSENTRGARLEGGHRPLERLLTRGAAALTLTELWELLLSAGTLEADGARELLGNREALARLARCSLARLVELSGLDAGRAAKLMAVFELVRRLSEESVGLVTPITSSADAARLLVPVLRLQRKEVFSVLCLDTKGRARAIRQVSVGSLSASIVHPREVFAEAIQEGAASVILAHNHPSGDPSPSPEDVAVTHKLVRSGDILGIPVVDHVIVGDEGFVSFQDSGLMPKALP
ncbi:MAG: DNA repair protein RadC [Candidatus Wallbacteria bacterium]|nr:DNA repair protein RadC [Candidatus Wallbacteria bacterium]